MKLVLKESFGKLREDDIKKLEAGIKHKLPLDYISFLLKNNGGRPNKDRFQTKHGEYTSDIQFFYGITDRDIYDLNSRYNALQDRLPKQFLAIANNSSGDKILLNLKDERIFFFDHNTEEITLVSDSFLEFLSSLYKVEVEESELDKAVSLQNLDYFRELIKNGKKPDDIVNEFNQPMTIVAALWNKLKLLKFFVENKADFRGALFSAAGNGHLQIVKYLLSVGANVNERDESQNNNSVFLQACRGGYLEIVKLLVNAGADVHAVDEFDQTALDLARYSDNEELVSYLENEVY